MRDKGQWIESVEYRDSFWQSGICAAREFVERIAHAFLAAASRPFSASRVTVARRKPSGYRIRWLFLWMAPRPPVPGEMHRMVEPPDGISFGELEPKESTIKELEMGGIL